MPIVRIDDPKIFIGMSTEGARRQIVEQGYEARLIASTNHKVHKPDYDPLRVTLIVEKDKVLEATIG